MLKKILLLFILLLFLLPLTLNKNQAEKKETIAPANNSYWLLLHRKSNKEYLYQGVAGEVDNSRLLRVFQVKAGRPDISPTPLHTLLGRDYWLITKKESSADNPETAPFFITLDIPATGDWPYGPVPYEECNGQCDWILPGYFGLHGINGDSIKLSEENPGSFGCVRHRDEDISFLYNILTPEKEEIRYYIKDI